MHISSECSRQLLALWQKTNHMSLLLCRYGAIARLDFDGDKREGCVAVCAQVCGGGSAGIQMGVTMVFMRAHEVCVGSSL